jgi:hypothetical protein
MTPKLTVDDVRHHAEEVRDLAKRDAERVVTDQRTQLILAGVVAVAAVVSIAYFVGSRRAIPGPPLPPCPYECE